MSENPNYSNIADIKNYWLKMIAPNYLNLADTNNYQTGIFGFVNEIMANSVEDIHNSINISRREFYPVTAQFSSSLYKMAPLVGIDIPMTVPATARCALLASQKEIIDNSQYSNGVYTCVIDSVLKIQANDIQFMLDYPIVILSKKAKTGWSHTIHYDISTTNSLNSNHSERYISSKLIKNNGTTYLVMVIDTVRQVEMNSVTNLVMKDNLLSATTFDINFNGDLANFEVFYSTKANRSLIQLRKVLLNGAIPNVPFCYYDIVNAGRIRISFPANNIFMPEYNSEIITNIYTSRGAGGNFSGFEGSLTCTTDSELYPYNSNIQFTGFIQGAASGGRDAQSADEFKQIVIDAYSTNNTITTSNDLQIYFDRVSNNIENMKVLFRKKRDDAMVRLFGAYVLLKDEKNNVTPTNTLDAVIRRSQVMDPESPANRVTIKPGTLFEYINPTDSQDFRIRVVDDKSILDDLDPNKFYFTNPFLIGINVNPSIMGYYLNSVNNIVGLEYVYVNDGTDMQFMATNMRTSRDAISGKNYYKFSIGILPASSDIDVDSIVRINDDKDPNNMIRARKNGKVIASKYISENGGGFIRTTVKYSDNTTEDILSSNYVKVDDVSGEFIYTTGYKMLFDVGVSFLENDILATKFDDDLAKIRIGADIGGFLYSNKLYIPFVLEKYDAATGYFSYSAYLSTDDMVDLNGQIIIAHGMMQQDGTEDENIAIPMNNLSFTLHAFYKNDEANLPHKYSDFAYMTGYTMTNSYLTSTDTSINLIEEIGFIRSILDFTEGQTQEDYNFTISELPVLDASWAKSIANYNYFVEKLSSTYARMRDAYRALENNFSIDLKFYNTYGKARFYRVGITGDVMPLNSVNCTFRFGVKLNTISNTGAFIEKFRIYIKDYLESINNATSTGQNVYIMNLIADIKNDFPEVGYLEYYGFNTYDFKAQIIIGPEPDDYNDSYIPEFINIKNLVSGDGTVYPGVTVTLLDS